MPGALVIVELMEVVVVVVEAASSESTPYLPAVLIKSVAVEVGAQKKNFVPQRSTRQLKFHF